MAEHAILFDLDGTLLDHEGAVTAAIADFRKGQPLFEELSLEEFHAVWFALEETYYNRYLAGEITFQEQRMLRMKELHASIGVRLEDEEAVQLFSHFLQLYRSHWKLFDDVLPLLRELKHVPLGVITNGEHDTQFLKLQSLGIEADFRFFIASGRVGCAKPNKEIFEWASQEADVPIHQCVYIGDRFHTDAVGSQEAGMKGIWLNRKLTDMEDLQGITVIYSLTEVPSILEKFIE
ncbi:HAD family hydrolase [Marinicrinis lubricantis]|uniref:HAD family hydrolase n=1 Tax=Marinicrinis lubricantis TaxID=2086470 RepID=A0ABW1IQY1_9BACL